VIDLHDVVSHVHVVSTSFEVHEGHASLQKASGQRFERGGASRNCAVSTIARVCGRAFKHALRCIRMSTR